MQRRAVDPIALQQQQMVLVVGHQTGEATHHHQAAGGTHVRLPPWVQPWIHLQRAQQARSNGAVFHFFGCLRLIATQPLRVAAA